MNLVRLKMNDSKTEFIVFESGRSRNTIDWNSITVNGINIERSDTVRLLGAWLDKQLSFKDHILRKAKIASLNLQRIKAIRKFLTQDAVRALVQSLVMSHLDYANSLLVGLPESTIKVFQLIQNNAAKLVLKRSKFSSSTDALKSLHWLPIKTRIKFKIICLVHKCLYGKAPGYLKDLLIQKTVTRSGLRSESDYNLLIVPKMKRKTFAARSFSVAGPMLWNSLNNQLRLQHDHLKFRKDLKTFLFTRDEL